MTYLVICGFLTRHFITFLILGQRCPTSMCMRATCYIGRYFAGHIYVHRGAHLPPKLFRNAVQSNFERRMRNFSKSVRRFLPFFYI
jgi:hypothetical protein